jgi:membrane associated rhomboid family serine protease
MPRFGRRQLVFVPLTTTVFHMLSDRPYMRDQYPRERTSVLVWLVCAIVAGFILQLLAGAAGGRLAGASALIHEFGLSIQSLKAGHVWTLVTHGFLHDKFYLFHVTANLLALYFIGREVLPVLGARRFVALYFGAIVTGGLAWTLAHWKIGGEYFGATAAVDAILVVFACFYPHRRMDFLLFFIFPVSLKPKHLALGLLAFDLLGLLFYELRNLPLPFNFAVGHAAHLGGMLAGWVYFRYFHDVPWQLSNQSFEPRESRGTARRSSKPAEPVLSSSPLDFTNPSDLRAEVDRILDKINSHGFGALTPDEKRLLDEAKDLLSRR